MRPEIQRGEPIFCANRINVLLIRDLRWSPYDGIPVFRSKQVGRMKVAWVWDEAGKRRASEPRTAKETPAGLLCHAAAAGLMWGAPPSVGFAVSSGRRSGVLRQLSNANTRRCSSAARHSGSLPPRQLRRGAKRIWLGREGGSCTADRGGLWRCQHKADAGENLGSLAGSAIGDRTGLRQTTTEC